MDAEREAWPDGLSGGLSPTKLCEEPPDVNQLDLAQVVELFRTDPSLHRQVSCSRANCQSAHEPICSEVFASEGGTASSEADTGPKKGISSRYVLFPRAVVRYDAGRVSVSSEGESDRLFVSACFGLNDPTPRRIGLQWV